MLNKTFNNHSKSFMILAKEKERVALGVFGEAYL